MRLAETMQTLDTGSPSADPAPALDWLAGLEQAPPGGDVAQNGAAFLRLDDPATGRRLACLPCRDAAAVAAAMSAARAALPGWAGLGPAGRAERLLDLAGRLGQRAPLLALLAVLEQGTPLRQAEAGVTRAIRHLRHAAPCPSSAAQGVCALVLPASAPLETLLAAVAPLLAAGHVVLLRPGAVLGALYLAELAAASLPDGVLHILPGDQTTARALAGAGADHLALGGTRAEVAALGPPRAGSVALHLDGASPIVVFEDADLDSAAEAVVQAIWQNGAPGADFALLMVQESIEQGFCARLRARMDRLRIGDPLNPDTDTGPLVPSVGPLVQGSGAVHLAAGPVPEGWHPPALVTGLGPADPLMQGARPGAALPVTSFRTAAEALSLVNALPAAPALSVWSDTLSTALDLARGALPGLVWINAAGPCAPSLPLGADRDGGGGRWGGLPLPQAPGVQEVSGGEAAPAPLPAPAPALRAAGAAQGWAAAPGARRAEALIALAGAVGAAGHPPETAAPLWSAAALARTPPGQGHPDEEGGLRLGLVRPSGVIALLAGPQAQLADLLGLLGPALALGSRAVLLGEGQALPVLGDLAAALPAGVLAAVPGDPVAHLRQPVIDRLWVMPGTGAPGARACAAAAARPIPVWRLPEGQLPDGTLARAAGSGQVICLPPPA